MKINPLQDSAIATATSGVSRAAAGAKPPAQATGASAVEPATNGGTPVTVSKLARSMEPVSAGDGVDTKKVAAMREAIANGTYKVNADAIADKLLTNAQEILSRARR